MRILFITTWLAIFMASCAYAQNMGVDTIFTVTTSSTVIFNANSQRGHIFCQNVGANNATCAFGTVNACTTSNGRTLVPGAYFEYSHPITPKADLCCITTTGTTTMDCYQGVTAAPQ